MNSINEITLVQVLQARDKRFEKQNNLIEKYEAPLVSFTVNIPGAHKETPLSGSIFQKGYSQLIKSIMENGNHIFYGETKYLITGPEAYVVVDMDEVALKELVIKIESLHPLGRLFDFDVVGRDGNTVSRENLGYPKRKCLICDEDAHACARSKKHSIVDLTQRIQAIADSYFKITI